MKRNEYRAKDGKDSAEPQGESVDRAAKIVHPPIMIRQMSAKYYAEDLMSPGWLLVVTLTRAISLVSQPG